MEIYDCWEPDRICFSVSKDVLFHGTRLFGNRQKGIFDVTLEIKGAKVCGKYSADGNDRFRGFDVMLESPIVIEANEVVTLTARIKGQSSTMGVLGKTSVECHGVLVTFSNAHSPNHHNSTWMGQFPNIILSI
jgi:hypothetical protein